jgi:hypothetical protein
MVNIMLDKLLHVFCRVALIFGLEAVLCRLEVSIEMHFQKQIPFISSQCRSGRTLPHFAISTFHR